MRSSTRLASLVCLAVALAGCELLAAQRPGDLAIRSARIAGAGDARTLELALDCRLSGPMQDALDHGIPLVLHVDLARGRWFAPSAPRAEYRIELRYFPLSRRYQLRELEGSGEVRSFPTPAYLLAGLGSLRLALTPELARLDRDATFRVDARFETASLPGALRLPALFEPAWRLSAAEYRWQPEAG